MARRSPQRPDKDEKALDELPLNEYYEEYLEAYDDGSLEDDEDPSGLPDGEAREALTIFKPRDRKPAFALEVLVNTIRLFALAVVIGGVALVGAVVGIARAYMDTAPELDLTLIDDQAQTSFIYDAQGTLITQYKGTENRVMVSIDTMPAHLQNAFIAVEDARFYTHNGVDLKRIVGAFIRNFTTGSQQGGSTITQQLIKNTLLSSEQSYKRKIQEAYLAIQLESSYTKRQILESYLNTIYLGENYYGVKTAAYGYFGKENLSDLTLRECAMLAGLTTNPYYYNPRRNYYLRQSDTTDYRKVTDDRTDYVLRCMYENQLITRREYEEALDPSTANVMEVSPESAEMYPYPHYVEYAIRDVIQALLELNGLENTSANRKRMDAELRTGGYQIFLCIDTEIQTILEDTIYGYTDYPELNDSRDAVYRVRNSDGSYDEIVQPQAAAVVTDYRTGKIRAIVGSRTRPVQRLTLNRAADMHMPVGSAIKPLSVYAPAVELGHGDSEILYNMPIPINGWKGSRGEDTWPRNYSSNTYRGAETMRDALVRSDNTAAAYALMNLVGVDRSYDYLIKLGISPESINKTPFGLALGSSGITPIELAMAYGALGNNGEYRSPMTFEGIFDADHHSLYDGGSHQTVRRVFSGATAWLTISMMEQAVTSSSGTGHSAQISGQTVAGKTGTNSDQRGVCFAGMTGWYLGTVWIGHDNYKALAAKTTGGNSAAKLWKTFMTAIHRKKGLENRPILGGSGQDYGLTKVTTCKISGQLATDACSHDGVVTGWWPVSAVPTVTCQMHIQQTVCRESDMVAGPYCTDTEVRGVVTIPRDHPLARFVGTEYQDVLARYLGTTMLSEDVCTWHLAPAYDVGTWDGRTDWPYDDPYGTSYGDPYGNPYGDPYGSPYGTGTDPVYDDGPVYDQDPNGWYDQTPSADDGTYAEAQRVLEEGRQQLGWMQPGTQSYENLAAALGVLENQMNSGAQSDMLRYGIEQVDNAMRGY